MKTSGGGVRAAALCTLFALAALAFLLPGGTFDACTASSSFTGLQLVTHTAPSFAVPGGSRADADATVDSCMGDPGGWLSRRGPIEATFALVAALLGFMLAALRVGIGPGWCAATGLIVMLVPARNIGLWSPPTPDPRIGYWLALLAFAVAGVWCLSGVFLRTRAKRGRGDEGGVVWRSYRYRA